MKSIWQHARAPLTRTAGVVVLALVIAAPLRAQNLVANGGFETGDFTGWDRSGNLNVTNVVNIPTFVHSGTYGARLGPVGSVGNLLQQGLATTVGSQYVFSFWLKSVDAFQGNCTASTCSFKAYWDDVLAYTGDITVFDWRNITLTRTSTLPTGSTIRFEFRNDPDYYALDDVSVTAVSAVPEPASLTLMLTGVAGLLGVGVMRRRRST